FRDFHLLSTMSDILDHATVNELTQILGEDLAEFFGTFISYSAGLLGQMTRFTEQGDRDSFIVSVHSFKGSARNLGALKLAERLSDIERQARESGLAG